VSASEGQLKADQVLDAKGLLCPMPVIKVNDAIKKLNGAQVLEVLATDPGSKPDLAAWAKHTGHQIITVSEEGSSPKVFRFMIRKKEA
jgi:TusA-related sulfurtransferase